jgi:signal transduction histidine kinase/CheY-like chemotaxis protein
MARQASYGWAMYALFTGLFCAQSDFGTRNPAVVWSFAILIFAAGASRVWCARRILSMPPEHAETWIRGFTSSVALQSVMWGAFVSVALWKCFGRWPLESAILIAVTAFSAGGFSLLSPRPSLASLHIAAQWIPAFVWSLLARDRFGLLILTLLVAFLLFAAVMVKLQYTHAVTMLRTQMLLEERGEELRRAKEVAEEASAARARFVANMSHEIRTPLNGLLGLAQVLEETGLNSEQSGLLDSMQRSGDQLLAVVNDVLDFSKIAAGRMAIEHVPFDLASLAREVAAPAAAAAEAKGLCWRLDFQPGPPGACVGDLVRIRQVLANLLNNAVKFTESGEVALEVRAGPPGWVRFTVVDTGIGIAPERREELFQDFTQADASTTRRFGGTGLGLAISRRLAELMGGFLSVESEAGRGSRFLCEIPLPRSQERVSEFPGRAPAGAEFRLPPECRILVAEDNPINRAIITRFLARTGATVDVAETGKAAVASHFSRPYDLILMDCHMPEMDGYEAAATIRLHSRGGNVPIIAVTASAFNEDCERCLRAGMNDHVAKPLRRGELLEAVRVALQDRPAGGPAE